MIELSEQQIIEAISQKPIDVKLSSGTYSVSPITMRRLSALTVLLKDAQGDPTKFSDPSNPEFHRAVAEMLVSLGDMMPKAMSLFTGDKKFEALEDVTLIELAVITMAWAKVNRLSFLKEGFHQAMEILSGKASPKSGTHSLSPCVPSLTNSRVTDSMSCWTKLRLGLIGLFSKQSD
jgi:hypothetical protein